MMVRLSDINIGRRAKHEPWDFFRNAGRITDNTYEHGPFDGVKDVWKDEPCFVVGCGESLKGFDLSLLDGMHTIGMNHVIEDYDKFEWFIFLDKRFLEMTSYNMHRFKGRIFASNMTGLRPFDNWTVFKTNVKNVQTDLRKGLYHPHLTGLAALNLAVISGANPIYYMGQGQRRGADPDSYHYKDGYTGANKTKEKMRKYRSAMNFYVDGFENYSDRIINVTDFDNQIYTFPTMTQEKLKKELSKIKVNTKVPKIVHFSFTNDISKMGDISREIINNCYGDHELHTFNGRIPRADLYILEHFISTNNHCLAFPYKNKAIDLVHTTNCYPKSEYGRVVALTDVWKKILSSNGAKWDNIDVIYGGIDLEPYKDEWPDYDKKVFGRITRWSPGKIPKEWNDIVKDVLEDEEIECLMYVDFVNKSRKRLAHPRMIYDESAKISDYKGQYLKNMSVYVHANGSFKETMSHACIEAMATGLPVIYLSEPAIDEVVGDVGIKCNNLEELKSEIINMLEDKDKRIEYGLKSKERAKAFDIKNTIRNFDELIKELLCQKSSQSQN